MWILVVIFFAVAIVALVKYFLLQENPEIAPEESAEYFNKLGSPGQNPVQGIKTRSQLKRDKENQEAANSAIATATEGIHQTTAAEEAHLTKEATKPRHEEAREVEIAATKTVLTQHNVIQTLANNALEVKMSVENHQQYLLQKFLSELKVDEHKQLTELDLDNRWKEIVQDLDAGDLLVIAARGVIKKFEADLRAKRIEKRNTEKDRTLGKPLRLKLLDDIDKSIEHLEGQIRDWQKKETGLDLRQNQTINGQGNDTRYITEGETDSE